MEEVFLVSVAVSKYWKGQQQTVNHVYQKDNKFNNYLSFVRRDDLISDNGKQSWCS